MSKPVKMKNSKKLYIDTVMSNIIKTNNVKQRGNNRYAYPNNMNEPKTIKAGAYIQVSTDEQAENSYSLQLQRECITTQIAAKGWELFKMYEDGGQSSGKLERPALQEMLRHSSRGVASRCYL